MYAISGTQSLLFGDSHLTTLLMWAALVTMVVGILGAIAQTEVKRMLSFTLVSHIGYLVFGVALATTSGYAGARSSTPRTTSPSRRRCSSSWGWSRSGRAAPR